MTERVAIVDGLLGGERGAVFCNGRCHRYELWRIWDPMVQPVLFVMLNPSTADEDKLDPTVKRCVGYAQRWGYGGVFIGNLYGYRAKDRDVMLAADNPVGLDNDEALVRMAALAGRIVVAWGSTPEAVPGRAAHVLALLREHGQGDVYALAINQDGQPGHPLYLLNGQAPVLFDG